MGNYIETFKSKLNWANTFERTDAFPLDRTSIWGSYEEALKYAKGEASNKDKLGLCGLSYPGQIITVYENSKVTPYKITEERNLEKIDKSEEIYLKIEKINQDFIEAFELINENINTDNLKKEQEIQKLDEKIDEIIEVLNQQISVSLSSLENKIDIISKSDFEGGIFVYNKKTKTFDKE